jgi:carbon storage regulator CsrA
MLRINRRAGETIVITTADDDEIRITLDEIDGNFARLSLQAPRRVTIDRLEIHELRKKDG